MGDFILQDRLSHYLPEENLGLHSPSKVMRSNPINRSNSTCGFTGGTKRHSRKSYYLRIQRSFWRARWHARLTSNGVNGLVCIPSMQVQTRLPSSPIGSRGCLYPYVFAGWCGVSPSSTACCTLKLSSWSAIK